MNGTCSESFKPVELYYTVTEPRRKSVKPPIICLPGMLETNLSYLLVKEKLANRTNRKVYCIDPRNFGKSGYGDNTLKDSVGDILHFLHQHKLEKAVLVGHSYGGRTAMQFALNNPEKVEKLVVEEMSVDSDEMGEILNSLKIMVEKLYTFISNLSNKIPLNEAQDLLTREINKTYWKAGHVQNDFMATFLRKNKDTSDYEFDFNIDAALKFFQNPDYMKGDYSGKHFSSACLFMFGGNSAMDMSVEEDNILKYFSKARVVTVKGAYHHIHREALDNYLELVSDFINE